MRKFVLFLISLFSLSALNTLKADNVDATINVDLSSHGHDISPTMYGVFFEEINHAGDGGLYGEMLMNRSFEEKVIPEGYTVENNALYPPKNIINYWKKVSTIAPLRWNDEPYPAWEVEKRDANVSVSTVSENPEFESAPTQMKIDIKNIGNGVSLLNKGYWGIALEKGANYKFRMFMRNLNSDGDLSVRLLGKDDKELGKTVLKIQSDGKWHEYKSIITASDTTSIGRLSIDLPTNGTYYFDYVSLFPEDTYKGRENGMRKDVAIMLENLKPAFVRWPGGCIVEGVSLSNRVEWKKTLGDPASRSGQYDMWGYRNTYGFGYKEFLDFCEDLGAKAMYVCNVGLSCFGRTGQVCTDEEAAEFLQDALDAIEYAIGDVNTKWGAVRAKEGHPDAYPLAYVEIGNENFGDIYDRRYNMFYDAIKAKYPQLTLISNYGLNGTGEARKVEMVDPHWYVQPEDFFKTAHMLDNHARGKYDVYVGEYSCNQGVGGGNMLAALSEAALLTGLEYNSDIVKMTSYAPLLENKNDRAWPVNLIWMSNNQVVGRSSYYVQKMFATNRPTYNLQTNATIKPEETLEALMTEPGYIGLGTWGTQVKFRNLKIKDADGNIIKADMQDPEQWTVKRGEWKQEKGVYGQTSIENRTALIWNANKVGKNSIVEFEVNKQSGNEGFLFFFGLKNPDLEKGFMLNVGGWGNTATTLEGLYNDNSSPISQLVKDYITDKKWHKVKIVIKESIVEYYLDKELIFTHKNPPVNRKFYVAGYDEKTNEIVIKFVNASDNVCNAKINLNNGNVDNVGRVIKLKANSKTDENSFEEPYKISPVENVYNNFSSSFSYNFEPNSLTILRIKKK